MSLTTTMRAPVRAPPTFLAPCLSRYTLRSGQSTPFSASPRHSNAFSSTSYNGSSNSSSSSSSNVTSKKTSTKQLVPSPTPFCPDASTFLQLIGRDMGQHAAKFASWEALFGASSSQLKEMGVEPARSRRYLLWWRDQFRRGRFGVGGEMAHVNADGVGEVRVRVEPDGSRVAVNVPAGSEDSPDALATGVVVAGLKVTGPGKGRIVGSYFEPVQGTAAAVARIKVADGVWEVKRGRKIHGGERRRKNVLSRIAAKARGTLT